MTINKKSVIYIDHFTCFRIFMMVIHFCFEKISSDQKQRREK